MPEVKWRLQLRGEFYNAFNHAIFTDLDTAECFDAQGNQTNVRFDEPPFTRGVRRVQFALRLAL